MNAPEVRTLLPHHGDKNDVTVLGSKLRRSEVHDGCQIQNLKGKPTCNPRACGQHPSFLCSIFTTQCHDWNSFSKPEVRSICRGCSCRVHTDKPGIDVYPVMKSTQVSLPAKKIKTNPTQPDISRSEQSGGTSYVRRDSNNRELDLERRTVSDGCVIMKMEKYATCYPEACGRHPQVECSKAAGGHYCTDSGSFKRKRVQHLCSECSCRNPQSVHKYRSMYDVWPNVWHPRKRDRSPIKPEDPGKRTIAAPSEERNIGPTSQHPLKHRRPNGQ